MNPSVQIVNRAFPTYALHSSDSKQHLRRNSHCVNTFDLGARTTSALSDNHQELQRLRQIVFALNMEVAACKGAKQKLEKTAENYQNMENYYLTELQARKSRADYLESQLAVILEEYPSHKPLRIPQTVRGCNGCEDNEQTVIRLAQQLQLKNQLLISLDSSYKSAISRVSQKLQPRTPTKITQDKENSSLATKSIETQTLAERNSLEPQTLNKSESNGFKRSKVILKRIMPQRSANTSINCDR